MDNSSKINEVIIGLAKQEPIISAELKKEMSLSDETQFQTDNFSRILKLSCPTLIGHLSRISLSVIPDLIGYLSRILKLSCPTWIGHLSRINKEVAGIFGSKLSFCPKMTVKGLMTVSVLAFIISLNLSTAWAINCPQGTQGSDNTSDSNYCGANCCWGINEGVLTITPALDNNNQPYTNVTMKDFNATKPGTNNEYTSQFSSDAPWARSGVTAVVVKEGISNIGKSAFRGETQITNVNMTNVTSIGQKAFFHATSLTDIDMQNVTEIDSFAFQNATSLANVSMPKVEVIGEQAFYEATALNSVDMPNVTEIGMRAFYGATSLTDVNMTNVETIGITAFYGAESLESIAIPNISEIGSLAFAYATSLKYAELPTIKDSDNCLLNAKGERLMTDSSNCITTIGGGDKFANTQISACSSANNLCSVCTNTYSTLYNGNPNFQSNSNGGSCVATCTDGYTASNGLCKPIQAAQNNQQNTGTGAGSGTGTASGTGTGTTTAANCTNGASIGGECFPKRYTPAEIAELVGESNTILLYYK